MKFAHQRFFVYDRTVFQPSLIGDAQTRGTIPGSFPVSGIEDVYATMSISQEFFSNFPKVTVKELSRQVDGGTQQVDAVYREPKVNAPYQYSRILTVPGWITFADPQIKHGKTGETLVQPIDACFCILDLHEADFFPNTGDHILFNGRLYEIAQSIVKANEYFQNTMIPLYVHAQAGLYQYGDRKPPQVLTKGPVPRGTEPNSDGAAERSSVN